MVECLGDVYFLCASAVMLLIATGATIFFVVRSLITLKGNSGPWGLPLFGFYPFLREDFHVHLTEMVKNYGDPYLLSMCGKRYLHISSHKILQEVFVTKVKCFSGRITDIGVLQQLIGKSVSALNGEAWGVWRKFFVQNMKVMVPQGELDGPFLNAVETTLNTLRDSCGQLIDIGTLLSFQCAKANGSFLLGEAVSDDTILKLMKLYRLALIPISKKPMLLCGNLARCLILCWSKDFRCLVRAKEAYVSILYDILNDHRRDFDADHPKDFIDFYLKEKGDREGKGDPQAKYFNDVIFLDTLVVIYGESGLPIGNFIAAYLKYLAKSIDVQEAIYEEIFCQIGKKRLPTYQDRHKMPYTISVLQEIERVSAIFPVAPLSISTCDVKVGDVFVPKGTICLSNSYAIHHDPTVYENPEKFDPKRFMSDDPKKYPIPKNSATFRRGKRSCAGEVLVKAELFIFVAAIMQNFTLYTEDIKDLKSDNCTSHENTHSKSRIFAVSRKDAFLMF